MRLQLPTVGEVSQGLYGQIASTESQAELSSYLYGWESSWFVLGQQAHIVVERQKLHGSYYSESSDDPYLMVNDSLSINDQNVDSLWSAGGYLLFSNDQQLQLFVHRVSPINDSMFYQTSLEYQLPYGKDDCT